MRVCKVRVLGKALSTALLRGDKRKGSRKLLERCFLIGRMLREKLTGIKEGRIGLECNEILLLLLKRSAKCCHS